jgi:hypothetical protein
MQTKVETGIDPETMKYFSMNFGIHLDDKVSEIHQEQEEKI